MSSSTAHRDTGARRRYGGSVSKQRTATIRPNCGRNPPSGWRNRFGGELARWKAYSRPDVNATERRAYEPRPERARLRLVREGVRQGQGRSHHRQASAPAGRRHWGAESHDMIAWERFRAPDA